MALNRTLPTIHRSTLPVDDLWHVLSVPGPIVGWACRRPDAVDLWFWSGRAGDEASQHVLRVFGTGHPVHGAEHTEHRATVLPPGLPLVWHVLEWMGRPGAGAWPPADGRLAAAEPERPERPR
jgi:hypothetical protein